MRTTTVTTALLLGTLVIAGAGPALAAGPNGEATKPATTVLSDSVKALQKVKTVKLSASVRDGKQTLKFTFTYLNGVGATGTFSEGKDSADIIRIGKTLYFKGNAALIGGGGGSALAGRYIRLSATSGVGKEFDEFTDLKTFAADILKPTHLASSVGSARVGSTPAVVLTDSDSSKLYISATGAPLPLKVVGSAKDPGTVTFTKYDAKVTLKAPADSITI